jgi:hypothetical protein
MRTRLLVILSSHSKYWFRRWRYQRRAARWGLLVGINENPNPKYRLQSCVNDAAIMQNRLINRYGFAAANISALTDAHATRKNIMDLLAYYQRQASAGDLFVFYYSGHGTLFPDKISPVQDETEQCETPELKRGYYDSAIVPIDAATKTSGRAWGNLILDDELNEIFSKFTANGVQVIFISDSCHSGTLAKGITRYGNRAKFISPKEIGFDTGRWISAASEKGRKTEENFNDLLLAIGASRDDQTSLAGGPGELSLFTQIFITKLDEFSARGKIFTYRDIKDSVKPEVDRLTSGEQIPSLDDRFFSSDLLDAAVFSLAPAAPPSGSGKIRVVIKVVDGEGNPIGDAAFGVISAGVRIGKGEIKKKDVLVSGKTNGKGLFNSGTQTLSPGRYQVKVVRAGYQAFTREMQITANKDNTAVLKFKLLKE